MKHVLHLQYMYAQDGQSPKKIVLTPNTFVFSIKDPPLKLLGSRVGYSNAAVKHKDASWLPLQAIVFRLHKSTTHVHVYREYMGS